MKDIVLVAMVLFTLSILSNAEAKAANSFGVDLIHRDSPLSPFYNSSLSQSEIIRNVALRSIFRSNSTYFTTYGNKVAATLIPNVGDYLMKIFIGNPPVESHVTVDTGSDLIWVQCLPCIDCYPQQAFFFDPRNSTTYKPLPCHSDACNLMPTRSCGSSGQCRYYYSYADESMTVGDLATDVIGFSSNVSLSSLRIIFGCGHENSGIFKPTATGIAGLGGSSLSLVSQLGFEIDHIFSYCLLPLSANATSKLTFGTQSTLTGKGVVSTPLIRYKLPPTYYLLSLEGISIDSTKITALKSLNIIIDSGTALTRLETSFYKEVETEIAKAIDDEAMRDPPSPFKLCYREATKAEVPDITFHFAGGADILLPVNNMFIIYKKCICLLMLPRDGISVFGNMAQVNFEVEFNITKGKVSFARADCRNG